MMTTNLFVIVNVKSLRT